MFKNRYALSSHFRWNPQHRYDGAPSAPTATTITDPIMVIRAIKALASNVGGMKTLAAIVTELQEK